MKHIGHRGGVVRLAFATCVLATLAANANAQTLPPGWAAKNIGSPEISGSASFNSGTFSLSGAGDDIGGTYDQLTFVERQISGDATIVARVGTLQNINPWSMAGVMIRESLSDNSKHASVFVTPVNGVAFRRRISAYGTTAHTSGGTGTAPLWLKLVRQSNTVTAYRSANGTTWTTIDSATVSMTATVYIGLAITSHDPGRTATATFTNVSTSGPNQPPTVSLTASGTTFPAPASIGLTATASDADGTIAGVDFYSGTTLIGSDTTSPYTFTWSNVPAGAYSLTAVARDNGGATTTSSARSVTVTAPTNQIPTASLTAPVNGAPFTAPAMVQVSATAGDADGTVTVVEFYAGSTLVGSDTTSPYSVTWSNVSAGTYSLTAVARDNGGATGTSAARTITVSGGLPSGWTASDVGAPGLAGSTQYSSGTYTLQGAGEVGGTADAFHFAYRQVTGDVTIQARVASIQAVQAWSKAGVMVRASLAANSAFGMMFISASSGSAFHQRVSTGAARVSTGGTAVSAPYWVRLERRGTVLTASQSSNGVAWTTIGTMTLSGSTIYVGLAAASAITSQLATGVFDNVLVTTPTANQPPTVSLTANGTTFPAPASIGLTATASDADGTIAGVDFYSGTTLIGSDTTSPYTFTWSNVPAGAYSLTAVARDNGGATTTSSARSVTVTAPTNQIPTASLTAPVNGAPFTAPAMVQVSATAGDADGTVTVVEFYAGSTLVGSDTTSPYSVTWSNVSAGTYSLTAVARDNGGATGTSAARTITVSGGLPSGWTASDVGAPGLAGSTQYSSGTYTLQGAGEVGGTADAFHFAYRQVTGDVTIQARVASIQAVQAWSKAGVMVRASLAANSAFGMMFISASSGGAFHQRVSTGAARVSTGGTAVSAPYWVRLERRGTVLTASQSSNGVAWTTIGTMTLSGSTIYVGLAAASAITSQLATGVFDNVLVTTPTANQPPTVSLTTPANGASFSALASIALAATASDADGTIVGVDFYAGTTFLATDASSPYTFNWIGVAAGSYNITAVARDNGGATTTSALISVSVLPALTIPPLVSLTVPAAGAVFTAPGPVAIAANASDTDGTVTSVEFYAGSTLIGTDTTAPYSMTWNNVAAGLYTLTAVARDNAGAMTVSGARDIRVDASTLPRTAVFTASSNHATAVDRYFLEIFPAGANPLVANPVATRDLGKPPVVSGSITVDVSATTVALPPGSYIATVTAIGSGGSARSAASPAFVR